MITISRVRQKIAPRSVRAALQLGLAVLGTVVILGSLVRFATVFTAMPPSDSGFAEGLAIILFGLNVLAGFVALAAGLWLPQHEDDGIQFLPRQRTLLAYGVVAPIGCVLAIPIGTTIVPPLSNSVSVALVALLVGMIISGPIFSMFYESRSDSGKTGPSITFEKGLIPPIVFLVVTSLWVVFVPLAIYPLFDNVLVLLAVMAMAFAVIGAIAWLTLRWEGLAASTVGLSRTHVILGVLLVALIWLAVNIVGAVSAFVSTGDVRFSLPGAEAGFADPGQPSPLAFFIGMAIAQLFFVGIAEELAFRAYLQNKLIALFNGGQHRTRKAIAILLGVFLFMLWHIPQRVFIQDLTSPVAIAQSLVIVMILGIVLGLLYEYTRNVVFVGALHGTFNLQPVFVIGVDSVVSFLTGFVVLLVVVWYYRRWMLNTRYSDFQPQVQE